MKKIFAAILLLSIWSLTAVGSVLDDAEKSVISAFNSNHTVQEQIKEIITSGTAAGVIITLDKNSYTKLLRSKVWKDGTSEFVFMVYRQIETSVSFGTSIIAIGVYNSKSNKSVIKFLDLVDIVDRLLSPKI